MNNGILTWHERYQQNPFKYTAPYMYMKEERDELRLLLAELKAELDAISNRKGGANAQDT